MATAGGSTSADRLASTYITTQPIKLKTLVRSTRPRAYQSKGHRGKVIIEHIKGRVPSHNTHSDIGVHREFELCVYMGDGME